jgi:DNA invertase Pin-like site-specific DNA recombinase
MRTADRPPAAHHAGPRAGGAPPAPLSRPEKIKPAHLARLAVVYVRPSSPQQVLEHRESAARQYALAEHAAALGWPRERVLVIDEGQGHSGRDAAGRPGFQRLLAELTMDHVGLVLGLEMSRLARSDRDWHHLLELCGVFGALLGDQDGVYDAGDPNDRLLLGLKGTMSSLELQTMRNRLDKGKLSKARRGELFCGVPVGYVRVAGGTVALDPDEQVRATVSMLFDKFDELGTVHALFRWLARNRILLPVRARTGPTTGEPGWRLPRPSTLAQLLHHPIYAGAYAYGRRPADAKRHYATGKRTSRAWLPMEQWQVLIRDRLPAYISWERYPGDLERMKQNRTTKGALGAPRHGRALLCGLVRCGRCNWRLQVSYREGGKPHYFCKRHLLEAIEPCGCNVSAAPLDELVSELVLGALTPAALELSVKAQADVRQERDRLERHWRQVLQRALYDAAAAERRYRAVDPENRLVAATLERQWEEALRALRAAQEDHDRFLLGALPGLSAEEEGRIAALAEDIPALWRSEKTTNADRRSIVRCLVEGVVVHAERDSEHARATVRWAGGHETRLAFVRPVRTYAQLRDREKLIKRIAELREGGLSAARVAAALNEEGHTSRTPGERFTADMVRGLFAKLGAGSEIGDDALPGAGEWWLHDLAGELGVPWRTLRIWAIRGCAHARQTNVQRLRVLWADRDELRRLRQLRSSIYPGRNHFPEELTTPKHRPPAK